MLLNAGQTKANYVLVPGIEQSFWLKSLDLA